MFFLLKFGPSLSSMGFVLFYPFFWVGEVVLGDVVVNMHALPLWILYAHLFAPLLCVVS